MADEAEKKKETTIAEAALNVAALVKQMMKDHGLNFNQAWIIVKDSMDRQQHFQDNQVALLINGFNDSRNAGDGITDEEADIEAMMREVTEFDVDQPTLSLVTEDGEVVS